ncbi:MAG: tRNA pseudouridine(13) synthase TruD [Proteobacteria bacterium]|nr:MAG: tRNA pseudouridine(13) synthase TruD [Pseudomonadota bacterium]
MDFSRTENAATLQGDMRSHHEDFQVDEIPDFLPTGEGEHVCLKVRKTGQNTEWVGKQLADIAGIARRDVSYAGLKDRHAVTTQWFSVWLPGQEAPNWSEHLPESIEILEEVRHHRKVRIGTLKGNRFKLILRNCQGDRAQLAETLAVIATQGVPNYFGPQRFGHEFHNIERATLWFGSDIKPKARHQKKMYVSAARSLIFNQYLSHRVDTACWNQALDGDVYQLEGTNSCFYEALDETIMQRVAEYDLHPTGPMWGAGALMTHGNVRQLEQEIADTQTLLCQGLEKQGLKQDRRALRLMVGELGHQWLTENCLELRFSLPPGSYATSVLRELGEFRNVAELNRAQPA